MKYRTLGRTGLRVSELGLGAVEIGQDWGIEVPGEIEKTGELQKRGVFQGMEIP